MWLTIPVRKQAAKTGEALVRDLADAAGAPANRLDRRRRELGVSARHVRLELAQHRRNVRLSGQVRQNLKLKTNLKAVHIRTAHTQESVFGTNVWR